MPEQDRTVAGADFEDLLREVLARINGALDEQARLRLLLDAVVSMAADLTLDGVLARIVEISRHLTGAQYAALGVLNSGPRKGLRTFVHHGMTPVQVEQIGDLPTGHGILGLLIDRPEPLRLHEISAHPESYGFPAHHPPMKSFLGVPVRIRDQVFGNLYLTEKTGSGDFTQEDEEIVVALAAAAGVAIENARLYEETGRREEWLAASAEITGLLSGSGAVEGALQVVADRARQLAAADVAWLVSGTPGDIALRAISGPPVTVAQMRDVSMDKSLSHEVIKTGEPIAIEDMTPGPSRDDDGPHRRVADDRPRDRRTPAHRVRRGRGAGPRVDARALLRVPPGRPATPGELCGAGCPCAPARAIAGERAAAGPLRGPRPDRSGPPRPRDPATLRRRAEPAERERSQ